MKKKLSGPVSIRGRVQVGLGGRYKKKPLDKSKGFFNKYGSYLLSRIVVQYHRP